MNSKSVSRALAAIALTGAACIGSVHAKSEPFEPMGIELGGSCQQGVAVMGQSAPTPLGGDVVLHVAKDAGTIFPGAQKVMMRCAGDRVLAVALVMPKGAPGNASAREMYQSLSAKYKRVEGGPIQAVSSSYALFTKGSNFIKLSVPHMSFEYDVGYYTKEFWEELEADRKNAAAEAERAKRKL